MNCSRWELPTIGVGGGRNHFQGDWFLNTGTRKSGPWLPGNTWKCEVSTVKKMALLEPELFMLEFCRTGQLDQAGKLFQRSWQSRECYDLIKGWVWEVQTWDVRVCLDVSKIDKTKPHGESVVTEVLGRDNTAYENKSSGREIYSKMLNSKKTFTCEIISGGLFVSFFPFAVFD